MTATEAEKGPGAQVQPVGDQAAAERRGEADPVGEVHGWTTRATTHTAAK